MLGPSYHRTVLFLPHKSYGCAVLGTHCAGRVSDYIARLLCISCRILQALCQLPMGEPVSALPYVRARLTQRPLERLIDKVIISSLLTFAHPAKSILNTLLRPSRSLKSIEMWFAQKIAQPGHYKFRGGFCIYHGSGTFCDSIPALRAAGRKEGRFTHPWQPARLIGWNSVWVGQCDISAMTSCQGRL